MTLTQNTLFHFSTENTSHTKFKYLQHIDTANKDIVKLMCILQTIVVMNS